MQDEMYGGKNSNLKKKKKNDEDQVNQNGKLMRPKLHSLSTHSPSCFKNCATPRVGRRRLYYAQKIKRKGLI